MDGDFIEKAVSGVKRIDKYAGLIGLIASVVLGTTNRGPVFTYAFAGITVVFLSLFLLRVLLSPKTTVSAMGGLTVSAATRRVLAVLALLVLYAGSGFWVFWTETRPDLVILDVQVDDTIALERLVSDYPFVLDGTITVAEAVIAYQDGNEDVQHHVEERLSGLPVGLPPLELVVEVSNRGTKTLRVSGVQIRVYQATWLDDCFAYGPAPNLFVDDVHIRLCPWRDDDDRSYVTQALVPVETANLSPESGSELIRVRLQNAPSDECPMPADAAPAVAVYEIDVEVIYGDDDRIARYRRRQVIAVPTLRYALGGGQTGLESEDTYNEIISCHRSNRDRVGPLLDIVEDHLSSPMVSRFAASHRAAAR